MKAIGNWVVMVRDEGETSSGIITSADNIGIVVDCVCDNSIVGKRVCFDINSGRITDEYLFVPYDMIYGVVE